MDMMISKELILSDNQSTIDVFSNKNILQNPQSSEKSVNICSTAGVSNKDMIGELPGYGTAWYYPRGIANLP